MEKVTIQVKQPSLSWETIEKVEHTFPNWEAVVIFAYHLALQTHREVRVETKGGSGHYFSPNNAEEFLYSKVL